MTQRTSALHLPPGLFRKARPTTGTVEKEKMQTSQLSPSTQDIDKAVRPIMAELGERNPDACDCIRRLTRAQGIEFVSEFVERAKSVQAQGGLPRPGGGLRTLGGVFFTLVKESMGVEAYRQVVLSRWQRQRARQALFNWKKPTPPAAQSEAGGEQQRENVTSAEH